MREAAEVIFWLVLATSDSKNWTSSLGGQSELAKYCAAPLYERCNEASLKACFKACAYCCDNHPDQIPFFESQ